MNFQINPTSQAHTGNAIQNQSMILLVLNLSKINFAHWVLSVKS